MEFTETKGTQSDWSVQDSNEAWGSIVSKNGKVLDLFVSQCDIDGCPIGLYSSHGFYNQKWRRSGDKIVSSFPGYLAQDDSGRLVIIESPSDGNKDWTKLEIGNILTDKILWFILKKPCSLIRFSENIHPACLTSPANLSFLNNH